MSSWGDLADEIDGENNVYYRVSYKVADSATHQSCCRLVAEIGSDESELMEQPMNFFLKAMNAISEYNRDLSFECSINVLVNAMSVAFICSTKEILGVEVKKLFADFYLRYRHEFFNTLVQSYLSLPCEKSDVRFCDILPIDSKRTPDNIIVKGKNVIIIECTVSTDYEGSLFKKGSPQHGYTPKYSEEMLELMNLGYEVQYEVLVWDMANLENTEYIMSLHTILDWLELDENEVNQRILEQHRQEMMTIHMVATKNFSGEMSLVLSSQNKVKITPDDIRDISHLLTDMEFPNDKTYLRLTISKDIHSKLLFTLPRLPKFLQKHQDTNRVILVYHVLNSKFYFEKDHKLGCSFSKWSLALKENDLVTILLNTYVKVGGKLKESYKYDTGVDYFELQSKTKQRFPVFRSLRNSFYVHKNLSYGTWDCYTLNLSHMQIINSAFYDPNYEDAIIKKISKFDETRDWTKAPNMGPKLLANCEVNEEMQNEALSLYNEELRRDNSFEDITIPPKIYSFKNCFIFPIIDPQTIIYGSIKNKPTQIITGVLKFIEDQVYTSEILLRTLGVFEFGTKFDHRLLTPTYQNLISERSRACSSYYTQIRKLMLDHDLPKVPKYEEAIKFDNSIANYHADMKKKIAILEDYMKKENLSTHKLPLVKISTKGKSSMKQEFANEMSHFRNKEIKSIKKGYGDGLKDVERNLLDIEVLYENLVEYLISPALKVSPDKFIHQHVAEDASFLKKLKQSHLKSKEPLLESMMCCNITHITAFVSRLCHTLMYYSQCSFSTDYVAVDNLGYDNVILLVKGGKKIFKTKSSKLFRLIYPISSIVSNFVTDGRTSSFQIKKIDGKSFCLTPWITLHEAHLAEGISMHHKVNGFLMMNLDHKINEKKCKLLMFNVILALHGRRSTEELLHGVRYFIANNLGTHSNLVDLMPSFSGFNRDMFQFYIRQSLSRNYKAFSEQLKSWQKGESKNLRHVFCDAYIETPEDLTFLIYSTYLMTKAPITQATEQVRNLVSIMKIHKEVANLDKGKLITSFDESENFEDYVKNIFSNDMKVDLKMCSLIGKFCSDYILSKCSESKLLSDWESVLAKGWETLANTKGLRGEKSKGKFFGEKGYHVVLEQIVKKEKFLDCISVIKSESNDIQKRKKILKMNENYRKAITDNPGELSFHAVDKRQRGGGREIYVMDLMTKTHQQPIESFLKKVCKLLPNEVISIPSNKRSHFVHTKVFEKLLSDEENKTSNFLTLDCRKWAPKSSLEKYVVFIAAMSPILPEEFVRHFMRFFNNMLSKKFVTRRGIYEIFIESGRNAGYSEYFEVIDDRAEMKMNYSFMMGIFNYLSSLMHAANQMYASYLINKTSKISYQLSTDLTLLCHSDDSAGKILTKDEKMAVRCLFLYEVFLKSCNHLLSVKKSVMSKNYFEFLSILYYKNKLLPLLPKFLSGINFRPTDKGYSADVIASLNRSNELLLNGSTFDNAYLSTKVQSHLIWKFYFNKDPEDSDYYRPIQLLGMPDPHPLSALIVGSDCELLRILLTSGATHLTKVYKILNSLTVNFEIEESILPSLLVKSTVEVTKPLLKELIKLVQSECPKFADSWTVSNVNFRNTYLNTIQVILKCQDKSFVSAMQDEELTRRISRSYYFRSSNCVDTTFGKLSYKNLRIAIDEMLYCMSNHKNKSKVLNDVLGLTIGDDILQQLLSEVNLDTQKIMDVLDIMHGEYLHFMKYMDKINIDNIETEIRKNTCKPVHLLIQKTTQPLIKIIDPASLVSYIKEPEYRGLLPDLTNSPSLSNIVTKYFSNLGLNLENMTPTMISKLLNKLNSNMSKEFYFYSNLPSECRNLTTYHDLCTFLSFNSIPGKQILGISLYFSTSLQHTSPDFIASMMTEEFKNATCFISLCYNVLREEKSNFIQFSKLKVKMQMFSGDDSEREIHEAIAYIKQKWSKNLNAYNFISPYVDIILMCLSGEMSFSHTGALIGSLEFLSKSYFYCYLKKQKLVGNKWLGDASIYIRSKDMQMIVDFGTYNVKSFRFFADKGPMSNITLDYINYVLRENSMRTLHDHLIKVPDKGCMDLIMGMDEMGVFQIAKMCNLEYMLCDSKFDVGVSQNERFLQHHQCELSDEMSIRVDLGEELLGKSKLKINFMKLDVSRLQSMMLSTFIMTDENKLILNDISGPLIEQFTNYILRRMGLDLFVSFEELTKNFTNSKIYKMMYYLEQKSMLPEITERIPVYPGQQGGLLSIILSAKRSGFDVDVQDELVITSHMLDLKSSNPDSYLSVIYENLNIMYEKMYSTEMKNEISKEVKVIYDALVQGKDQSADMQALLRKWGVAGVEGSLVNYNLKQSSHFFDYFYIEGYNVRSNNYMGSKLPVLIKALITSINSSKNESRLILEALGYTPQLYNHQHLFKLLNGAILSLSYMLGVKAFFPYCNYPVSLSVMYKTLEQVISSDTMSEVFLEELSNDSVLRVLPVGADYVLSWFKVLTSLINTYRFSNKFKHSPRLNVGDPSNSLVRHHYLALGGDGSLSHKIMRYGGLYTPLLMSEITHKVVQNHENIYYHFKPKLGKLSPNFFFDLPDLPAKAPLNEDALDTDEYGDLKLELSSNDKDWDEIKNFVKGILNECEDPYLYQTKFKKSSVHADITILTCFGQSGFEIMKYVRQSGENILMICDFAMVMPYSGCHTGYYRPKSKEWDFPIFSSHNVIVHMICNSKIAEPLALAFCLDKINIDEDKRIYEINLTYKLSMNSLKFVGLTPNERSSLEDQISASEEIQVKEILEDQKMEDASEDLPSKIKKARTSNYLELVKSGISEDMAKSVDDYMSMEAEGFVGMAGILKKLCSEMDERSGLMGTILNFTHDVIKSGLKDKNTVEDVMQVPQILRDGLERNRGKRNQALHDPILRAEVNSISDGACDGLLAGNLVVDAETLEEMQELMDLCRRVLTNSPEDFNKLSMLNFINYFINDAKLITDDLNDEDQNLWKNVRRKIIKLSSKKRSPIKGNMAVEPGSAGINYKAVGQWR